MVDILGRRLWPHTMGLVGLLLVAHSICAVTVELESKRLSSTGEGGAAVRPGSDALFRMVLPQSIYSPERAPSADVPLFSSVIGTEPEAYDSRHVFRGVAELGSKYYGFVFDSRDIEKYGYEKLYFDINGNGDLTDDGVIQALYQPSQTGTSSSLTASVSNPNVRRESKRGWGPEQATGEPDTPAAGDIRTAWAAFDPDSNEEWLQLTYPQAVVARAVEVHETFNPGAVHRVCAVLDNGGELELWKGKDPTSADELKGVSEIEFETAESIKTVRLYIDAPSVSGWNEIDAVGLVDADGNKQWAVSAAASSTYASRGAGTSESSQTAAVQSESLAEPEMVRVRRSFPRVELPLKVADGTCDYAFFVSAMFTGQSHPQEGLTAQHSYVHITSAIYREGTVNLAGENHRIVLLDYNSNGRFNEPFTGVGSVDSFRKHDVVLIDPNTRDVNTPGFGLIDRKERHPVSDLIRIGDAFYELSVSESGHTLTLEPSRIPLGFVKNPSRYDVVVYGKRGAVKIACQKAGEAVALPIGDWRVAEYTLRTRHASKTYVSARMQKPKASVTVRENETTVLPFGLPLKPNVRLARPPGGTGNGRVVDLTLDIYGSDGALCTDMLLNGVRPPNPTFMIAVRKGKIIQRGNFEYG